MNKVMDYINSSLSGIPQNANLEKFKKSLLDEVTQRANDITHAGLRNGEIIDDIIISEHPNLVEEYNEVLKANKAVRKRKITFFTHLASAIVFIFTFFITFMYIGFSQHKWHPTWVILVDAILMLGAFILFRYAVKLSKSDSIITVQIPRAFFPAIIFLTATSLFLVLRVMLHLNLAWLTFIAGVLAMFIVDGIYAQIKSKGVAIIFQLLYIVPSFAMIYIILAANAIIPWHPGWLMVPASIIFVIIGVVIRLAINSKKKERMEVEDQWNED